MIRRVNLTVDASSRPSVNGALRGRHEGFSFATVGPAFLGPLDSPLNEKSGVRLNLVLDPE